MSIFDISCALRRPLNFGVPFRSTALTGAVSCLTQVRAQNLQDLVYKKGQAGIQKASVQLVFNNEDKATSPHGYEQQDQIIVLREVCYGWEVRTRRRSELAEE